MELKLGESYQITRIGLGYEECGWNGEEPRFIPRSGESAPRSSGIAHVDPRAAVSWPKLPTTVVAGARQIGRWMLYSLGRRIEVSPTVRRQLFFPCKGHGTFSCRRSDPKK